MPLVDQFGRLITSLSTAPETPPPPDSKTLELSLEFLIGALLAVIAMVFPMSWVPKTILVISAAVLIDVYFYRSLIRPKSKKWLLGIAATVVWLYFGGRAVRQQYLSDNAPQVPQDVGTLSLAQRFRPLNRDLEIGDSGAQLWFMTTDERAISDWLDRFLSGNVSAP